MRRAIGQSLRIGVSAHAVSLVRVSRWGPAPVTVLAEQSIAPGADHPFDAIANALRTLLGEQEITGWPTAFVLSDELTRLWRVTPPSGATRPDDLEAAAALRFHALYGEPAAGWQISADWNAVAPFFAAGAPRALLASLEAVAQEYKLPIVGIEPHFITAWNRWRGALKRGAWFALLHDRILMLAPVADDGMRAVRTVQVPPGADQAWLSQMLKREALLLDMESPSLLQVSGVAPSAWVRPALSPEMIGCELLGHDAQSSAAQVSPVALLARGGVA